jgi:hypothetical protein
VSGPVALNAGDRHRDQAFARLAVEQQAEILRAKFTGRSSNPCFIRHSALLGREAQALPVTLTR